MPELRQFFYYRNKCRGGVAVGDFYQSDVKAELKTITVVSLPECTHSIRFPDKTIALAEPAPDE